MERGVERQCVQLAQHVRHDGDHLAGIEEEPKLETTVDEHHLVGDGQHRHVEVGRLLTHAFASHDQEDERIAYAAQDENERKRHELDDVIVAKIVAVRFSLKSAVMFIVARSGRY